MFLAQGAAESTSSLETMIVLVAIASVLFWRIAFKLLLIGVIALVISGLIAVAQQINAIVN